MPVTHHTTHKLASHAYPSTRTKRDTAIDRRGRLEWEHRLLFWAMEEEQKNATKTSRLMWIGNLGREDTANAAERRTRMPVIDCIDSAVPLRHNHRHGLTRLLS